MEVLLFLLPPITLHWQVHYQVQHKARVRTALVHINGKWYEFH